MKLVVICDNENNHCTIYRLGDGVVLDGGMAVWRTLLIIQEFMNERGLIDDKDNDSTGTRRA